MACPSRVPDGLDLVFPGRDGKVASHTTVQADFDEVQRLAGIVVVDAPAALRSRNMGCIRYATSSPAGGSSRASRPSGCRRSSATARSR